MKNKRRKDMAIDWQAGHFRTGPSGIGLNQGGGSGQLTVPDESEGWEIPAKLKCQECGTVLTDQNHHTVKSPLCDNCSGERKAMNLNLKRAAAKIASGNYSKRDLIRLNNEIKDATSFDGPQQDPNVRCTNCYNTYYSPKLARSNYDPSQAYNIYDGSHPANKIRTPCPNCGAGGNTIQPLNSIQIFVKRAAIDPTDTPIKVNDENGSRTYNSKGELMYAEDLTNPSKIVKDHYTEGITVDNQGYAPFGKFSHTEVTQNPGFWNKHKYTTGPNPQVDNFDQEDDLDKIRNSGLDYFNG